jgi:hypothetical protein
VKVKEKVKKETSIKQSESFDGFFGLFFYPEDQGASVLRQATVPPP